MGMCNTRCDEGFKSTSYLLEAATSYSGEGVPQERPEKETQDVKEKKLPSGANAAFNFGGPIFEWMASPEQSWRGKRMGKAMQQLHRVANSAVIFGEHMAFLFSFRSF